MDTIRIIVQAIVALGLLNVWHLRFNKQTPFRGGRARSLREEFAAYGLIEPVMWIVGALKVASACALLAGIFVPELVMPTAALLVILMLGAVAMHIRAKDPLRKSMPAASVLILCLFLVFTSPSI